MTSETRDELIAAWKKARGAMPSSAYEYTQGLKVAGDRLADALSLSARAGGRDAIIEECAKVARRHMNIFHKIGEPGHFEIAETIEDEILALKSGDATSAWRPIESAPKDGRWVLIHDPRADLRPVQMARYGEAPMGVVRRNGEVVAQTAAVAKHWINEHERHLTPTHWQPLPAPPSGDAT